VGATPKYPWNFVTESRSGHVIEIDDSPGAERLATQHRTGSYWEFNPIGTFTIKSVLDLYKIAKGDSYDYVGGSYTQQTKGQSYRQSDGDMIFKTGSNVFYTASKMQFNTSALNVSGEINAVSVNSPVFSGQGGMAFGDLLAKEALVAYGLKKGGAPMLGGSLGFKGVDGAPGNADSLMSNSLSSQKPDGTPIVTNGVGSAKAAIADAASAVGMVLAVGNLLSSSGADSDTNSAKAMTSAAAAVDAKAALEDAQTPVFLKHVSFDKPILPSQSTVLDKPDPSLYVNNIHTIVDSNGVGALHMSNGTTWIMVGGVNGAVQDYINSTIGTSTAGAINDEMLARALAIAQEAIARGLAIADEAAARNSAITTGLLSEAMARGASVTAEANIRQTADTSLSDRIVVLTASTGANAAAILQETSARTDAVTSEATARQIVAASVVANTASITSESTARSNADTALGSRIDAVISTSNTTIASVTTEINTRTSADSALGSRIDLVVASTGDNAAAVATESTARVSADGALGARIDSVVASTATNAAAVLTEITARTTAESALGARIDTVVASNGVNAAAVVTEATARATAVGQVTAQWGVKTNVNGHVSGVALVSDLIAGNVTSSFTVEANQFKVVDPSAPAGSVAPFSVSGGVAELRGLNIRDTAGNLILSSGGVPPSGWLNSNVTIGGLGYTGALNATYGAEFGTNITGQITSGNASTYIASAAIGSAQVGTLVAGNIATGAITADKLNVTSLSAVTATIGTLRTATSGARMEIRDNVIKVYDSAGTLRVQIGDLAL
jgi:hypothetical protein